jgi:predicted protein tyrosine phosphatase
MLIAFRRLLSPFLGPPPPADLVWITTELAQSGRFASREAPMLARLAIGAVLDLRAEEQHDGPLLARADLHYLHLPIPDRAAPTEEELTRAADWVLQELAADRKVLVHCRLGLGRSVTVVTAVLMRMGYPLGEALALVRRRRPNAALTDDQLAVLQRYAASLAS